MNSLRDIRKASGLKVEKIAKELNNSRKTYYNKENGVTSFMVEDIIILSKLFNVEITEIVQAIRRDKNARIC